MAGCEGEVPRAREPRLLDCAMPDIDTFRLEAAVVEYWMVEVPPGYLYRSWEAAHTEGHTGVSETLSAGMITSALTTGRKPPDIATRQGHHVNVNYWGKPPDIATRQGHHVSVNHWAETT